MQAAFILSILLTQEASIYKFVLTLTSQGKSLLEVDHDKVQRACLFTHLTLENACLFTQARLKNQVSKMKSRST